MGLSAKISLYQLCEQENHTCYLCGERVLGPSCHPKSPMAPTRDHVIPLFKLKRMRAKGRRVPTNRENIRLAHKWCNHRKANKQGGPCIEGIDPFVLHQTQQEFDEAHGLTIDVVMA